MATEFYNATQSTHVASLELKPRPQALNVRMLAIRAPGCSVNIYYALFCYELVCNTTSRIDRNNSIITVYGSTIWRVSHHELGRKHAR